MTNIKQKKLIDTNGLTETHKLRIRHWCDALKSDRYIKGSNVMRNIENCYCVMGVACEISNLGNWQPYNSVFTTVKKECYSYCCSEHDYQHASLPKDVFEYYGFHLVDASPWVMYSNVLVIDPQDDSGLTNISYINDCLNLDFKAIAVLIEETYLK